MSSFLNVDLGEVDTAAIAAEIILLAATLTTEAVTMVLQNCRLDVFINRLCICFRICQ